MSGPPRPSSGWQRNPAVRLRREAWGGIAFHRVTGDLLELDAEGFAVLMLLGTAHSVPGLLAALSPAGGPRRLAELASFLHHLERERWVRRVPPAAPPLLPDPLADRLLPSPGNGLSAPLVAHWAVTYRCNLHCPFCYSESGPHREAGPGPEVRRRVVERLAVWGILEVALDGGEPTILPDFPELLAAIRAAGMVPNVTTNGTVQHPAVLRALAEHAGVVHLSADRPDLLDTARGQGVFDRLRGTARLLREAGVRLGVNLLLTPDNIRDVRRSLEALLDLGVQGVTFLRPKGGWPPVTGPASRPRRTWTGWPATCVRSSGPGHRCGSTWTRPCAASGRRRACWPTPSRRCSAAVAASVTSLSPRRATSILAPMPACPVIGWEICCPMSCAVFGMPAEAWRGGAATWQTVVGRVVLAAPTRHRYRVNPK
jgi:hypothetical protein